jgi:nucleoside-diphosphate-sugar epimerase
MLGFRTKVSLEEGLERLVRWWEAQRALKLQTCA